MPPSDPGLDTSGVAALLQQRFSLEVERHNEDVKHTEARLRSALKELEIVRAEEARVLVQRTAALRREHEAAMQALERRFLADAEALQARLREGLDRETGLSQATIDAKAGELLGGLGMASGHGASLAAGASPAAATFGWPPAAAAADQASPAARRPRSAGGRPAASSRVTPAAQPPAVAAANEAIAALRAQLPPSPAKLRASGSPCWTGIKLTATSGSASGAFAATPAPRAAPGAQRAPVIQAAAPLAQLAVTGASAQRQQSAKPTGLSVRFAAEPTSSAAPAASQQGSSSDGFGGRVQGGLIAGSSSEFDDDSWLDEDSCGEEDLVSARPPPVKTIQSSAHTPRNLTASRCASFAAIGAAYATGAAAAIGAGVSRPPSPRSGGKVHLNLVPVAGTAPGSPSALRSYSPCVCSNAAEAVGAATASPLSPRSAGARTACCGVLSGSAARSYTSD